jgi:uncharacterized repeat protein (TIGR03803 family)
VFGAALGVLVAAAAAGADEIDTLYSFKGTKDGAYPGGGLVFDTAGNLYGTASSDPGTAFRLTPSGGGAYSFGVLQSFKPTKGGIAPNSSLLPGPEGSYYGTTSEGGTGTACGGGCGTVFRLNPPATGATAWTKTVLYSFANGDDGSDPMGGLSIDGSGALYGTASRGGANGGWGTVFRLTPPAEGKTRWVFATLYTFTDGNDGGTPEGGVVMDEGGALYGTTFEGGPGTNRCGGSCGTAFKLTPARHGKAPWPETTIYAFGSVIGGGNFTDGNNPIGGLVFDASGTVLYGTTIGGGTSDNCPQGCGTVFSLTASGDTWTETVIHSFSGVPDGYEPDGALSFDASGALWGAAGWGGISTSSGCQGSGCGTIFKLTNGASGWTETTEYSFTGGLDGGIPTGGLVFDAAGNPYGTTAVGGPPNGSDGFGTVFELTPSAAAD